VAPTAEPPPAVHFIRVCHAGGAQKRVQVEAVTPQRALVHWPIAGQYALDLRHGYLTRPDDDTILPWRALPADLRRLQRIAPRR
jgi:hypothetical protein